MTTKSDFIEAAHALGLLAQHAHLPAPAYDGSKAAMGQRGYAYLLRPRQRAPSSAWFAQTAKARELAQAGEPTDLETTNVYVVVHWRRLLSRAVFRVLPSTPAGSGLIRQTVHRLWWNLLPLVEVFDVAMAALLRKGQQAVAADPRKYIEDPFWVGLDDAEDQRNFDAQLVRLMKSFRRPETPSDGFCDYAARSLAKSLSYAGHAIEQRHIGLCIVGKHHRGTVCPTCPEIAEDRRWLTVFDIPVLMKDSKFLQPEIELPKGLDKVTLPSPALNTLRWVLEAEDPRDGVFAVSPEVRAINVNVIKQRMQSAGVESLFDAFALNKLADIELARDRFTKMVHVFPNSDASVRAELFFKAKWNEVRDVGSTEASVERYNVRDLQNRLHVISAGLAALSRRQRVTPIKPRPKGTANRRAIVREFILPGGRSSSVGIVRAKSIGKRQHNFFTTPFEVDPMYKDPERRRGKGIRVGEVYYWTLQALNEFANARTSIDEATYPDAVEFREWANLIDAELYDNAQFKRALFEDNYAARIQAVKRGDKVHLGRFSKVEDNTLVAYLVGLGDQRTRLSPTHWAELLLQLPTRGKMSVLRRLEELGKEYAREHGYKAYMASAYHRHYSAQRRARWHKDGIGE